MKLSIFISLVLISLGFQAKQNFPGIDYSYVKVYMFNIDVDTKKRPDSHIYYEGKYAESKIGDGLIVSEENVNALNKILSGDINALLIGLSNCYIPRHGFIYYDKENKPVASVSICLECEKISIWTNAYENSKVDYKNVNVPKAEKQLKFIKDEVLKGVLPIFENTKDYLETIQNSDAYKQIGEMFLKGDSSSSIKELFLEDIKKCVKDTSKIKYDVDVKYTMGGDKYEFKTLEYLEESKFLFQDNSINPKLAEATIVSTEITLPNGVRIGMSLDDILSTFAVYDGLSTPEKIVANYEKVKIEYTFHYHTLRKIKIYVY